MEDSTEFPPVPEWEPDIPVPLDRIIDRMKYYTNHERDFVVFVHGTCVLVEPGLSDSDASAESMKTLDRIFHFHPDMSPMPMDDGNIVIQYSDQAFNVVLSDLVSQHRETIKENHLRGLTRAEVLVTPLGPNKFDEFGFKALFGRCFFFMDAKAPKVERIVRAASGNRRDPNAQA